MAQAPVCHIPGTNTIQQPPPNPIPAIPVATDLASALAAINIIRQILAQPKKNNGTFAQNAQTKQSTSNKGRWSEAKRTTERVRIENPTDPSQFVEIDRINNLTMQDAQTGDQWTWNRGK